MRLNKIRLKFILAGVCLFSLCNTLNANEKDSNSAKVSEPSKSHIIEEKIGVSAKSNKTLASLYEEAVEWLKTPYRRGGMSHKGMDCSGLASTIYQNVFGIKLERRSKDMSRKDVEDIGKEDLKPGDLVFFATKGRKNINHVGVYLGNDHFVHASIHNGVIISSLDESYYKRAWVKGGRIKEKNEVFESLFKLNPNFDIDDIDFSPMLIEAEGMLNSLNDKLASVDLNPDLI